MIDKLINGCYPAGRPYGRDEDKWYYEQMDLKEWPYVAEKETDKPHIEVTGACTAGYLRGIWASSVEQINDMLSRYRGTFGLVFAITGANNEKWKTDDRLIEVGFKIAFQVPNFYHSGKPIKLWAIDLQEWGKKNATVKQPVAVVR